MVKEYRVRALVLGSGADGTAPTVTASLEWRSAASPDDPWHPLVRILFNTCEGVQRVCMETRTKLRSLGAILFTALTAQQVSGMPGILFAMSSLGAAKLAVRGPEGTARYTAAARSFVRRKYPDIGASDIKVNCAVVFESALAEVRAVTLRLADGAVSEDPVQSVCYAVRFALPILPGAAAAPCFAALLVVDFPTPALLDAAIASPALARMCARAVAAAESPLCVAHFAPETIAALPRYAAWLERTFGSCAHHVRLAPRAAERVAAFRAATTAQAVMHALAPASYVAPPFDAAPGSAAAAAALGDDGHRSFRVVAVGAGVVRGECDAAWRTLKRARDRDLEGVSARPSVPHALPSAPPLPLSVGSVPPRESESEMESEPRRVAEDGVAYTQAEFEAYFSGCDEWDAATPFVAKAAVGGNKDGTAEAEAEAVCVALALDAEEQKCDVPPIVTTLKTATAKDIDALVAHVIAAARDGASAQRCAELDIAAASAATRKERRWRAMHTLGAPRAAEARRDSAAPWAECIALAGAAAPVGQRHPLKVVFLGTGAASPSRQRGSSAIWLAACGCASPGGRGENSAMLLDCGEGAYCQLHRCFGAKGIDKALLALKCIWISHAHLDHHMGLVRILAERGGALRREHEARVVRGGVPIARPPLTIIAPNSIQSFLSEWFALPGQHRRGAGFSGAAPRFRFVPHGQCRGAMPGAWPILPPPFCAIQSVPVVHCPAAFGVVIDVAPCGSAAYAAPCRIVYSGDTRPCERLARAGFGATLALHEATFADDEVEHARRKRHSTVSEALGVARAMRAHALVLTHFSQRRFVPKLSPEAEADPRVAAAFDLMAVPIGLWPLDPAAVTAAGGFGPRWRWCARLPGASGAADGAGGVTIDSALLRALFEGGILTAAVEAV